MTLHDILLFIQIIVLHDGSNQHKYDYMILHIPGLVLLFTRVILYK